MLDLLQEHIPNLGCWRVPHKGSEDADALRFCLEWEIWDIAYSLQCEMVTTEESNLNEARKYSGRYDPFTRDNIRRYSL